MKTSQVGNIYRGRTFISAVEGVNIRCYQPGGKRDTGGV